MTVSSTERPSSRRAAWRCECRGECGQAHEGGRCQHRQGDSPEGRRRPVILTVHHINGLPWDHHPGNLLALCEGCHNHMDMPMRQAHAKQTRERGKGLRPLFEVIHEHQP